MVRTALIVEDIAVTRQWLAGIVQEAFPDCEVVEVEAVNPALELIASHDFDLAVIDLKLPDGSGLSVVRKLHAKRPEALSIIATVMGDDVQIVAALSAGAHGYLLKDQPGELLIRQLKQAVGGCPALSPPVARRIMEHFCLTGPSHEPEGKLTPRETEVLGLIARGLRIADAACALGVAEGTVASHVKSIYRKLGISTRAEAALQAMRLGLL